MPAAEKPQVLMCVKRRDAAAAMMNKQMTVYSRN
jgi:hypothetical protein